MTSAVRQQYARRRPKRLPSKHGVNYRYALDSASEFGRKLQAYVDRAHTREEREAWALEQLHLDAAFWPRCVYGCQCGWCFDADRDSREGCERCFEGAGLVPCDEHDSMEIFDERFSAWRRPLTATFGEVFKMIHNGHGRRSPWR